MKILDGKQIGRDIRERVAAETKKYLARGIQPKLAIIVATDDAQTNWYVSSICRAAARCRIETRVIDLGKNARTTDISAALKEQTNDASVHGLILQTPLPTGVHLDSLLSLIPPEKDIDGATPLSAGRLAFGLKTFVPATAAAVESLIDYYHIPLAGKHVVIVGRSRVVGKPVAQLLLARDATITICHSHSSQLSSYTKQADILVVAVGKPGFINPTDVKQGVVIIDVGTNVVDGDVLVGDVAETASQYAAAKTPVPGGIGPITTAIILQHTLDAVRAQNH